VRNSVKGYRTFEYFFSTFKIKLTNCSGIIKTSNLFELLKPVFGISGEKMPRWEAPRNSSIDANTIEVMREASVAASV